MTSPSSAPVVPLPFGSWPSPLSAASLAGSAVGLGSLTLGTDGSVCWLEGRPTESGRSALVRRDRNGRSSEPLPAPWNVRTRVHEYGGGAYVALPDAIVFSRFDDQQLYRVGLDGGEPEALTETPTARYADAIHDPQRDRLIAIREEHAAGPVDPPAALVAVDLGTGLVSALAEGRDFFASPALSPDGRQLAWLAWDHPSMPWDAAELWMAEIAADGSLQRSRRIAGGPTESCFQPQWSPSGRLHVVSDRSGWWNLYRLETDGRTLAPLHPRASEFGRPQWVFGQSNYGFDADGRIVCCHVEHGRWQLARLDPDSGRLDPIETPFVAMDDLRVGGGAAFLLGKTVDASPAVVRVDLASGRWAILKASSAPLIEAAFVSVAEPIEFPTGPDAGANADAGSSAAAGTTAYGYFYAPNHPGHTGPAGMRPPLLVLSHGGPTSSTDAACKGVVQYWTTRGFAVVDVDYGGSTGHGRAYRERLDGRWGIVDVDDCIAAARFLVGRGAVDPDRIAIRGGSAGGYTTLCALTFRQFFKAGASHYGIGDLEALMTDTHKFESRYLDRLIGPWPAARETYRERSPIHHVDRLASPLIVLQGAEDKVVPPSQAEAMVEAVRAKGLPVAYLLFEGEQHGFRRAETIRRALEAELYFYGRVFGFEPAGEIEPVEIANLAARPGGR